MRAAMGDGRFGPVYLADDLESGRQVVIRVFERVDAGVTDALIDALNLLCTSPLDHPAIAKPLACGIETSTGKTLPFLVHAYLPGTPLEDRLAQDGAQPLAEVAVRVAQVAAAIDFAAAAGVHHGVLGVRDIILNDDSVGVTGFGLVQALGRSGIHVPGASVSHADDIYALAAIAFQLLTGTRYRGSFDEPFADVPGADTAALGAALGSALSIDAEVRPGTALEFARTLQNTVSASGPAVPAVAPVAPVAPVPPDDLAAVDAAEEADLAGDTQLHELPMALAIDPAPTVHAHTPLTGQWRFGDEPEPPIERAEEVRVVRDPPPFVPPARASSSRLLLVAAAVLIAAVGGFAGGYAVGKQAVPTATANDDSSTAPVTSSQQVQEGTQGRTFTDAPIGAEPTPAAPGRTATAPAPSPARETVTSPTPAAPAPAASAPAAPAPAPARPPARPADRRTAKPAPPVAPPVQRTGPGSIDVLSRPAGAEVYVDGALVGRTPLSVPNIEPGTHAVRIALPDHQRWVTSVVVRPGEATRVAASLELATDPQ